jgi:hypothetical protein
MAVPLGVAVMAVRLAAGLLEAAAVARLLVCEVSGVDVRTNEDEDDAFIITDVN